MRNLSTAIARERVTIQHLTTTKDEYGEPQESWSDVARVKASVTPESGREVIRGERVDAVQRYLVTIRYRDDVSPRDRLVWQGRTLEIHQAAPMPGAVRRLELVCSEVGA